MQFTNLIPTTVQDKKAQMSDYTYAFSVPPSTDNGQNTNHQQETPCIQLMSRTLPKRSPR